MPTRDRPTDACPGALQVHLAADGGVARIRLPGGRLTASQLRAVLDGASRLGDGTVELTSRANLQIRGLAPGAESALAGRLAEMGLLPSATHERVRNIIASPLTGRDGAGVADVHDVVQALDKALCARPGLALLPGRFLFTVDDGRGDVAWLDADVAALFLTPDTAAVLLGDADVGLRAGRTELAGLMLDCAEAFLELRDDQWRIAELDFGPARIVEYLGAAATGPAIGTQPPTRHGPLGVLDQTDGLVSIGVAVPLGWLDQDRGAALARVGTDLVITPWRGAILTDLPAAGLDPALADLRAAGLLLDPADPGVGVSACTGKPGCAKALADVRADAAAMLEHPAGSPLPVHWSGCARRCGRPRGLVIDVVATEAGYLVGAEERPVPAAMAADLAGRGRAAR